MLGRAFAALISIEVRNAFRRAWRALWSRPPGMPEKSRPLPHRDAEHIRRHTHVPEEHKHGNSE